MHAVCYVDLRKIQDRVMTNEEVQKKKKLYQFPILQRKENSSRQSNNKGNSPSKRLEANFTNTKTSLKNRVKGYCIVSLTEALRWAKELKHDLVERDANPPGVKLQTTPMRSTKRLK
ncbi:unnamed protein product [Brassica oleracea var. botrytis]|uniref:(rape) hypothetical protein n=1 Tax=Brassica napus TaxID=3708 RepID=A0A816QAH2_BRANA|nr:unnamed protein product [Brassica napus]